MSTVANCPKCKTEIGIPEGVDLVAAARCPHCMSEFTLQEAIDSGAAGPEEVWTRRRTVQQSDRVGSRNGLRRRRRPAIRAFQTHWPMPSRAQGQMSHGIHRKEANRRGGSARRAQSGGGAR